MARVIAIAIALLLAGTGRIQADVFEATCRISVPGSMGTGIAFEYGEDNTLRVLTNKHVVGASRDVALEFWRDGHQSQQVRGTVIWESYLPQPQHRDMAIVSVPLDQFGPFVPRVVPLAPRGRDPRPGETVTSCGCPGGAWASAWRGHVHQLSGPVMSFVPQPAPGRSGSAILSADGSEIVGLLAWAADGVGYAMTLEEIYRALEGLGPGGMAQMFAEVRMQPLAGPQLLEVEGARTRLVPVMAPVIAEAYPVQYCGPGQLCPPSVFGGYGGPIQKPQPGPAAGSAGGSGPFPTYPYAAPPAPTDPKPRVEYATKADLEALAGRVDTLSESINASRAEMTQQVEKLGSEYRSELDTRLAAVEGNTAATLATTNDVLTAVQKQAQNTLREAVERSQAESQKITRDFEQRTVSFIEQRDKTIREHVDTVGTKQEITAAEAARQAVSQRIQEIDFMPAGKLILGALGISGLPAAGILAGAWLISRRLRPAIAKRLKTSDAPQEGASRPFRGGPADRRRRERPA